jgi:phosphonoacetaldehyde hydrolase
LSARTPKIRLVVFDWAGTTVDHGSLAPLAAFIQAFAQEGVEVSAAEARAPMGLHKLDHLRALLTDPAIARRWRDVHGRDPDPSDLERLYQHYLPLQLEVIDQHCGLVPDLLSCVERLRQRGIRIGATTGYFRAAAERVYREARAQGFEPDCCVCAEEVREGRPAPWMIFRIMETLRVYPPGAVVKVGDTVPDIEEGLNAGVWSVGVAQTGNEVGCTEEEFASLSSAHRLARLQQARQTLYAAGAHAVIDSVTGLTQLLDDFPPVQCRDTRSQPVKNEDP